MRSIGARTANVWFDFLSPGPRPLEIQVRNFHADDADRIEEAIEKACSKARKGEFSRFMVISAKDYLFEILDAASAKGNGPARKDARGLLDWSQSLAWQNLQYPEWRGAFEEKLLGSGLERIQVEARKRLRQENALWAFLLPDSTLD